MQDVKVGIDLLEKEVSLLHEQRVEPTKIIKSSSGFLFLTAHLPEQFFLVGLQFLAEKFQFYAFVVVVLGLPELDRALVKQAEQVFVKDFVAVLADGERAINAPGHVLFRVVGAIEVRTHLLLALVLLLRHRKLGYVVFAVFGLWC